MSYLHCPTCKRAFNIAIQATCPACPVAAQLVDPADDIVTATEQLARAMARATPDERADAMARMDRLALPAPGAKPVTFHGAMVKTIREALAPQPPPRVTRKQPLLERFANRVIAELAPRMARPRVNDRSGPASWLERYAPQARELSSGVRARFRALTA